MHKKYTIGKRYKSKIQRPSQQNRNGGQTDSKKKTTDHENNNQGSKTKGSIRNKNSRATAVRSKKEPNTTTRGRHTLQQTLKTCTAKNWY
jgi:hypothetical protein